MRVAVISTIANQLYRDASGKLEIESKHLQKNKHLRTAVFSVLVWVLNNKTCRFLSFDRLDQRGKWTNRVASRLQEKEKEKVCKNKLKLTAFFFFFARDTNHLSISSSHYHLIYPLTAKVVGTSQMVSQPVFSTLPCSPLPSGTCRTPDLSIPWCVELSSSSEWLFALCDTYTCSAQCE